MYVLVHPRQPETGPERYLKARIAIHLCIRNTREEQTGPDLLEPQTGPRVAWRQYLDPVPRKCIQRYWL